MENKNQVIIIALLALIAGLILGYLFSGGMGAHRGYFANDMMQGEWNEHMHNEQVGHMHNERGEHVYGDEIIDGDGAMMHAMDEMMMIGRGQTGEAYEEAWLRGMIVHHLGAVNMAEDLLEKTDRPELVKLSNDIIAAQTEEIEQMRTWLDTWFAENEN